MGAPHPVAPSRPGGQQERARCSRSGPPAKTHSIQRQGEAGARGSCLWEKSTSTRRKVGAGKTASCHSCRGPLRRTHTCPLAAPPSPPAAPWPSNSSFLPFPSPTYLATNILPLSPLMSLTSLCTYFLEPRVSSLSPYPPTRP